MGYEENEDRARRWRRFREIKKKRIYRSLAFLFLLVIAAFFILNLVSKDNSYSESENRMLAQRPKPVLSDVADGTFMKDYETYEADQFAFRDKWISLKLGVDKLLGKKESNGVYLGKKQYLMGILDEPDEVNLEKNLKAISDFAARLGDISTYMALVPNAAYVLKDLMPDNAPVREQAKDLDRISRTLGENLQWIDMLEPLKDHASEEIYYHTDHHWTTLGARYGFEAAAAGMGLTGLAKDYETYTVATDFQGTLSSKSGYHGYHDSIEIYVPADVENQYVVSIPGEEKKASLYQSPALAKKDKYEVFMGGNHALVDIETTNKNKEVLLIFKDSYANCLIPFLTPYYREIIVIDPRYYYDDVDNLISRKNVTQILFLYNLNSFMGDSFIADMLQDTESEGEEDKLSDDKVLEPQTID